MTIHKKLKGIKNYKTILFDCDGVLLNSNFIKTDAFYEVCASFGIEEANTLVEFHKENGGISRYKKFDYFFKDILKIEPSDQDLNNILARFSNIVKRKLKKCEMAQSLGDLKKMNSNSKWMIVSGGDQKELRSVFSYRNADKFFDAGIHGSPRTKYQIIDDMLIRKKINAPVLLLGDSSYDFEVSQNYNFDFIFVSDWTELDEWEKFCSKNKINAINNLSKLLELKD